MWSIVNIIIIGNIYGLRCVVMLKYKYWSNVKSLNNVLWECKFILWCIGILVLVFFLIFLC